MGRATFSYDFECLSGEPHELAESLDGLTNSEHKLSSFYMRALFWIFPAILKVGKKGEMIKAVKYQLGAIASKMWKDAMLACDTDAETKSLLTIMRTPLFDAATSVILKVPVKSVESSPVSLDEEAIISQMRTIISAGYETVSAIIAVSMMTISGLFQSLTSFSGYFTSSPPTRNSKTVSEMKSVLYPTRPLTILRIA